MLALQADGAHNVNLVSPSHVVPQIVAAVDVAARRGLRLPIVYNSNGYEGAAALRLLDGIVDIYMPDLKYGDDALAARYSAARGYVAASRAALVEMQRQVGDLVLDEEGVARRGLLIRHLVLPDDRAASRAVLDFVARELGPTTWMSVMAQYYPTHRAARVPPLARPLRAAEYASVLERLEELGLVNGYVQDPESQVTYRPDFGRGGHPFER